MAKTQEELKQLKKEYELLTAKLKELSEEELKLVTGGIGEMECKYHFRSNDWVYEDSRKEVIIDVEEDIDVNSTDDFVKVSKRSGDGTSSRQIGEGVIEVTAGKLIEKHQKYGGFFHAM